MAGLFGLIRRMDTKKMRATAAKVAQESGKSKLGVLADMVWCGLRYEAGYSDYALFHMWEMNRKQRASVLTRGKNNRYVRALNKHEDMHYFAEKTEFLKAFASYVGRRWLDLREAGADELREMLTTLWCWSSPRTPPTATEWRRYTIRTCRTTRRFWSACGGAGRPCARRSSASTRTSTSCGPAVSTPCGW